MKKLCSILIASLALSIIQGFAGASADDGIPLSRLAGKSAQVGQGVLTFCFKPDFSGTESCSAADAVRVAGNYVQVQQNTQDKDGHSCSSSTSTIVFPGAFPPIVTVEHSVTKVTHYDPANGSGDDSYITYAGGKCIGSKFDSTGASIDSYGTDHFVVSNNGQRVDFVTTTLTDSVGDIGAFNAVVVGLKQK